MPKQIITLAPDGVHPDDYECFPGVPLEKLVAGWFVESLVVPEPLRGRGRAKRALRTLAKRADDAGVWVFLHAYPLETSDFDRDQARLQSLYKGFGFVPFGCGWMARSPSRAPKKN